jgi:hypothetical protein
MRRMLCLLILATLLLLASTSNAQSVQSLKTLWMDMKDAVEGTPATPEAGSVRAAATEQCEGAGASGVGWPMHPSAPAADAVPTTEVFEGIYIPRSISSKLALFSDDGCDLSIDDQVLLNNYLKGQALPSIASNESFKVVPTAPSSTAPWVGAGGTGYFIRVIYSNTLHPDSSDIDGCTLFGFGAPTGATKSGDILDAPTVALSVNGVSGDDPTGALLAVGSGTHPLLTTLSIDPADTIPTGATMQLSVFSTRGRDVTSLVEVKNGGTTVTSYPYALSPTVGTQSLTVRALAPSDPGELIFTVTFYTPEVPGHDFVAQATATTFTLDGIALSDGLLVTPTPVGGEKWVVLQGLPDSTILALPRTTPFIDPLRLATSWEVNSVSAERTDEGGCALDRETSGTRGVQVTVDGISRMAAVVILEVERLESASTVLVPGTGSATQFLTAASTGSAAVNVRAVVTPVDSDVIPLYSRLLVWEGGQPGATGDLRSVQRNAPGYTCLVLHRGAPTTLSAEVYAVGLRLEAGDSVLPLNNDDDNGSTTADKDDTGTVVGENDLKAVRIVLEPAALRARYDYYGPAANISCATTGGKLNLWLSPDRSSPASSLPIALYDDPPTTLWAEGIAVGDGIVTVQITGAGGMVAASANATLTVASRPALTSCEAHLCLPGNPTGVLGNEATVALDVTLGSNCRLTPGQLPLNIRVRDEWGGYTTKPEKLLALPGDWQVRSSAPGVTPEVWTNYTGTSPFDGLRNTGTTPTVYRTQLAWDTLAGPLGHNGPHSLTLVDNAGTPAALTFQYWDGTTYTATDGTGPDAISAEVRNLTIDIDQLMPQMIFNYPGEGGAIQPILVKIDDVVAEDTQVTVKIYNTQRESWKTVDELTPVATLSGVIDTPDVTIFWSGREGTWTSSGTRPRMWSDCPSTGAYAPAGTYVYTVEVSQGSGADSDTSYSRTLTVAETGLGGVNDLDGKAELVVANVLWRGTRLANGPSSTRSGGILTVTTATPHELAIGDTVTLAGITPAEGASTFNGSVTVASIMSATSFTAVQAGSDDTGTGGYVSPAVMAPAVEVSVLCFDNNGALFYPETPSGTDTFIAGTKPGTLDWNTAWIVRDPAREYGGSTFLVCVRDNNQFAEKAHREKFALPKNQKQGQFYASLFGAGGRARTVTAEHDISKATFPNVQEVWDGSLKQWKIKAMTVKGLFGAKVDTDSYLERTTMTGYKEPHKGASAGDGLLAIGALGRQALPLDKQPASTFERSPGNAISFENVFLFHGHGSGDIPGRGIIFNVPTYNDDGTLKYNGTMLVTDQATQDAFTGAVGVPAGGRAMALGADPKQYVFAKLSDLGDCSHLTIAVIAGCDTAKQLGTTKNLCQVMRDKNVQVTVGCSYTMMADVCSSWVKTLFSELASGNPPCITKAAQTAEENTHNTYKVGWIGSSYWDPNEQGTFDAAWYAGSAFTVVYGTGVDNTPPRTPVCWQPAITWL